MKTTRSLSLSLPLLLAVISVTGCKTVVRENIISSVNTGVGITLSENPKTELYEVKLGFIRSQFYSVPTGKLVERDRNVSGSEQNLSNHAENTPEIVSGIKMNSDLRHLFVGATVSENFAVGRSAVNSPAAVAMYVGDAKNAAAAAQASSGLAKLGPAAGTAPVKTMNGVFDFIKALPEGDYPKKQEIIEAMDTLGDLAPKWDFNRYGWNSINTIVSLNDPNVALPTGYDRFKTYRGTLETSIDVLKLIKANPAMKDLQVMDAGQSAKEITPTQMAQVGSDLELQQAKLKALDEKFSKHPAVIKALDYFASIVKP